MLRPWVSGPLSTLQHHEQALWGWLKHMLERRLRIWSRYTSQVTIGPNPGDTQEVLLDLSMDGGMDSGKYEHIFCIIYT
jgi:hypothetical protein